METYVRPGILWWAFDRESAARQAERTRQGQDAPALADPNRGEKDAPRAVVLLDEIDKADPDVPNNLLVPLGSLEFQVEETGEVVKTAEERAPLVVITTNDERELPDAFLRRCVELKLDRPDRERLIRIGGEHFKSLPGEKLGEIADRVLEAAGADSPSPAEYLDTVRAWQRLGKDFDPQIWEAILQVAIRKPGRSAGKVG